MVKLGTDRHSGLMEGIRQFSVLRDLMVVVEPQTVDRSPSLEGNIV
jgi:hypothetical protein